MTASKTGTASRLVESARRRFDDLERFAERTRAWKVEFRQLDRAPVRAELSVVATGGVLLQSVALAGRVDRRGATPSGMHAFGLLDPGVEALWLGQRVTDAELLYFGNEAPVDATSRTRFAAQTFAIAEAALEHAAEASGLAGALERLVPGRPIRGVVPRRVAALRRELREIHAGAEGIAAGAARPLRETLTREVPLRFL